jgi:hypothetical protein
MPARRKSTAAMLPPAGEPFLQIDVRFSIAVRAAEGA